MKNLFIPIALLVLGVGCLSSCSTLFDVAPKTIYSPIDLSKTSLKQFFGKYREPTDSATVTFTVNDPALTYGMVVFYDSISTINLIKKNQLSGTFDFYPAGTSAGSPSTQTAKAKINPIKSKEQFQYFVPIGYTKDSTKIYYAQGYVRMKISPWTHFTDLPGYSTQYAILLFQVDDTLAYVKYNANSQDFIFLYEYDFSKKTWITKGKTQNEFCKGGCTYMNTPYQQRVDYIFKGYYVNNTYHLIADISSTLSGNLKYRSGEIILDQNFNYKTIDSTSNSSVSGNYIYVTDIQNDTLRVIYTFSNENKILFTAGYYTNIQSGIRSVYTADENITLPYVSLVIKNKLLVNSYSKGNTFTVYDLNKGQIKKINTVTYTDQAKVWAPTDRVTNLIGFSNGDYGYILNNNLNLYKVTINEKNEPVFSNFYATWFPSNSYFGISQGLLYKDKANKTQLIFLVNENELWSFDPEKIAIDFTAYTIVPL